jgi:hypothetical protein
VGRAVGDGRGAVPRAVGLESPAGDGHKSAVADMNAPLERRVVFGETSVPLHTSVQPGSPQGDAVARARRYYPTRSAAFTWNGGVPACRCCRLTTFMNEPGHTRRREVLSRRGCLHLHL